MCSTKVSDHHSIIIGTLVENAAEAIGANPLLARSCACYHDIGKGRNPLYFGENQKGENKHDSLAPAMSAVIIKRHVTEGLEMARQYRLPKFVGAATTGTESMSVARMLAPPGWTELAQTPEFDEVEGRRQRVGDVTSSIVPRDPGPLNARSPSGHTRG